jgi:signal transduction histidine kinase/ActR/RegA family two-component response regulator
VSEQGPRKIKRSAYGADWLLDDKKSQPSEISVLEAMQKMNNMLVDAQRDIIRESRRADEAGKRAQESMLKMKEALLAADRANEAKSVFLSTMSHDLRTPLNGVIGYTRLALGELEPDRMRAYLEKIRMSGELLLDLINDTLELSRIESGKMTLEPVPVSISEIASAVCAALAPDAEQRHIRLTADDGAMRGVTVLADRFKLQKIILNLISNAVKYTPEGGSVSFSAEWAETPERGRCCRLIVEDTGIGMSEEFMQTMFAPFSQEMRPEAAGVQGTGLGLSIVKRYVDLMGGTISADSKVGKGTRFVVELPLPSATEQAAVAADEKSDDRGLRGKRVLLCEDNGINVEIASLLLKEAGMEADCAENGKIGVEKFGASAPRHYDAILMDIRMPVMDGCEAAKNIRSLDRPDAKTIPIIAMTGDAFEESIRAAAEAGMNDYLTKPISPQKVIETLKKHIK